MAEDIGSLVVQVALDNSSFQEGMQSLNRTIRGATAEFRNSIAGLDNYGKGLDGIKAKSDMLSKQVDAQSKIVQMNREKFNESKTTLDENVKAQENLRSKLDEVKRSYETSIKVTGENSKETKELKEELDKLSTEYTNNEEKIRNNVRTMENWEMKANNAESRLKGMERELQSTNKEIELQSSNWYKLSQTLEPVAQKMEEVGNKIGSIGKSLTTKLTLPIVGVSTAAAKMGTDFNKTMASVATMIPGESERLQQLKGNIQDVAIEVAKSTDEIASGTYGVISAYGDAADTMDKVLLNAKAATAGLATTDDALNLSSAIMKGFGDTSAEANEKVLDLAFQTLKLGQTSIPDLASSIGKVVPTTNELGIAQEELFAVFATGTGVTGNASEISTQYQGVLKALMAPTKSMSKLMKNLGYENGRAMIEQEGLIGSIETIVSKAKEAGEPLQNYIGSIQGQVLALALAGEQSDTYREKLDKLMNSQGAMEVAFKEQTEGINEIGFTYEQAMIKMQVAGQKFGDAMAPILVKGAELISLLADKLNELTPAQQETILKLAALVAAIGPVALIFQKFVGIISGIIGALSTVSGAIAVVTTGAVAATPAIGALATAFTVLTGPVGLAIAGIASLAAGFVYLWKTNEEFKEKIIEIWKSVQELFSTVFEEIQKIMEIFIEKAIEFWEIFGNDIKAITETIWQIITTVIDAALQIIQGLIDVFAGLLTGDWERMTEGLKNIWSGMWQGIKAIVEGAWDLLKNAFSLLWDAISKWFVELAKDAIDWGKNIVKGIWEGIQSLVNWIGEKMKWFAGKVAGPFKRFFGIESPSKLMAGYGKNLMEGLAVGIEDSLDVVEDAMDLATKTINEAGIEEGIQRLSISTDDYNEKLLNQTAIVEMQKRHIEQLSREHDKLKASNKASTEEIEKSKRALESAKTELLNYERAVEETSKNIIENFRQVREELEKSQVDAINDLTNRVKLALKKRYEEEYKIKEKANRDELDGLSKWKDESIKRINSVYEERKKRNSQELSELDIWRNSNIDSINIVYDTKLRRIDETVNAQIKALQKEINALDKVEKERSREEEDSERLARINRLRDAIEYEHNQFNKAELQKELAKEEKDRDEQLRKWQVEDKKESLNQQINDIRENAEIEKSIYEQRRNEELARIDSIYEHKRGALEEERELLNLRQEEELTRINELYEYEREVLDTKLEDYKLFLDRKTEDTMLQAEAEKMIMDNNQKDIVELLHSYESDYKRAGQSLGEKLVEGFRPAVQQILDMINSVNKALDVRRTTTLGAVQSMNTIALSPDGPVMLNTSTGETTPITTPNNKTINNVIINSPKALSHSEVRRQTETTLRKLSFSV